MLAIAHVCALAAWKLEVDPSGRITSLSDGVHELVSPSIHNAPVIYYGQELIRLGAADFSPKEHGEAATDVHTFTYRVVLADGARLRVAYRVALTAYRADPDSPEVPFLNQTLSTQLEPTSPPPNRTLGFLVPRAATLRGVEQARGATRSASGYDRAATPWTTSDFGPDASWCYVAAGVQWDPPDSRKSPAYPTRPLALPMVDEFVALARGSAAGPTPPALSVLTDPYMMSYFRFAPPDTAAEHGDAVYWSYACDYPGIGCLVERPVETRSVYTVIHEHSNGTVRTASNDLPPLETRMTALYATSLAHVPAAPAWVRDISFVNYDFWSALPPSINGWDADVDALAAAMPSAAERSRVLFVCHGWYNMIGEYTLKDVHAVGLQSQWSNFPDGKSFPNKVTGLPVGPTPMDTATVRARLRKARAAGFRVLLYFADGLNTCEGSAFWPTQRRQVYKKARPPLLPGGPRVDLV